MKKLAYIFLCLLFLYFITKSFVSALILLKKDRINFVVYGQSTAIYSLGLSDDTNYFIPFDADRRVIVPGGYGNYRVGALGKLGFLDHKPSLLKQAFSLSTGSFVDIYFYPRTPAIYYHKNEPNFFYPSLSQIFLSESNASIFERIFINFLLTLRSRNQFKTLPFKDSDSFYKDYQGNFYSKAFRGEKLNIQVVYSKSYKTAVLLSRILEGEGLHVSDISSTDEAEKKGAGASSNCLVEENSARSFSKSAKAIALFFNCKLKPSQSSLYDILFLLGPVESAWDTITAK